jgi:putative GTP pyrophosphokinase
MSIELSPTGQVVTLECLLKTPSVCLYPAGTGPVLLFTDEKQRLWNVCRKCADNAFITGEWKRPGEMIPEHKIISQYELLRDQYDKFGELLTSKLKVLLEDAGIKVFSVIYRLKTTDSIKFKINVKNIVGLEDISDLVGVRIITPFVDDIDRVEQIIESEFNLVSKLSVSNTDLGLLDSFGYRSPHYVVTVSPEKFNLPEFKLVSKLTAEIQVRSILQQAWAEINHELQYKNETQVPNQMKRQLYRIGAILELADQDLVEFLRKFSDYRNNVNHLLNNE